MKTNPTSQERKRLTKSFFVAWLLDRKLAKVATDEPDGSVPAGAAVAEPKAFSSAPLAPGQIRVLSQTATLTYAAVLARWDERSFLLAPFSRFEDPATDEELKTAFQGGLRMGVLQIWNARTAMTATLRKSWIVGTLPEQDVKDALLLWKWSIGDVAELPGNISERTGVPIYRTDDPRLEYRREALENFAAFDAEDDANAERAAKWDGLLNGEDKAPVNGWISVEDTERIAAASDQANEFLLYRVDGKGVLLSVERSRSSGELVLSVLDEGTEKPSPALDGSFVLIDSETDPISVQGSVARVPVSAKLEGVRLVDPQGDAISLEKLS